MTHEFWHSSLLTTPLIAARHSGLPRLLLVWKWHPRPLLSWFSPCIDLLQNGCWRREVLTVWLWGTDTTNFTTYASKLLWTWCCILASRNSTQPESRPRNARLHHWYLLFWSVFKWIFKKQFDIYTYFSFLPRDRLEHQYHFHVFSLFDRMWERNPGNTYPYDNNKVQDLFPLWSAL